MKYLKRFNENINNESELLDYLAKNYSEDWFNNQFSERVYDYVSEEDTEDYDNDYEEAYTNLCMGGAIEYDLLGEIGKDVQSHFGISQDDYFNNKISNRSAGDIVNDYMMDNCTWYDTGIFSRSTDEYQSISDKMFGKLNWEPPTTGDELNKDNPLP